MTNRYKILLKMALVGVALAASGCSLGTAELVDDLPPGLTTAFGNAGGDHDNGNRGGNLPRGGGEANNGVGGDGGGQQGGDVGTAGGGEQGGTGPGNSDFGRGGHANAGGGNGSETADGEAVSESNPDVDPGNSGNSKGKSGSQD